MLCCIRHTCTHAHIKTYPVRLFQKSPRVPSPRHWTCSSDPETASEATLLPAAKRSLPRGIYLVVMPHTHTCSYSSSKHTFFSPARKGSVTLAQRVRRLAEDKVTGSDEQRKWWGGEGAYEGMRGGIPNYSYLSVLYKKICVRERGFKIEEGQIFYIIFFLVGNSFVVRLFHDFRKK